MVTLAHIKEATALDLYDLQFDKNRLFDLYESVFSKPVNRACSACFQDAYYTLIDHARQLERHNLTIANIDMPHRLKKFRIKKDISGFIYGLGMVSNYTMSDEVIAGIEKKHPQIFADHFEKIEKVKPATKPVAPKATDPKN